MGKPDIFKSKGKLDKRASQDSSDSSQHEDDDGTLSVLSMKTSMSTIKNDDPFYHVRKLANSKIASQKLECVVLSAIESSMKEKGIEQQSPIAYFAALLNVLERQSIEGENADVVSALLQLLSLVITRVPSSVLRKQSSQLLAVLLPIVELDLRSTQSAANPLPPMAIRALLVSTMTLFATLDQSTTPIQKSFKLLLPYLDDHRPKVRKVAHEHMHNLLLPSAPSSFKSLLVEFSLNVIRRSTKKDMVSVLHILTFVRSNIHLLPSATLLDTLFEVLSIPNDLVCLTVYQIISAYSVHTQDATWLLHRVDALISKQRLQESSCALAWMQCIKDIFGALARLSPNVALKKLPMAVSALLDCPFFDQGIDTVSALLSEVVYIETANTALFESLLAVLIARLPALSPQHLVALIPVLLRAIQHAVEKGIPHEDNHTSQSASISPLPPSLGKLLHLLASLYSTPAFTPAIRQVLSFAVHALHPEPFFSLLPLDLESDTPRPWLLSLLPGHCDQSSLGYFVSVVFPLAQSFKAKSAAFTANQQLVDAQVYHTLYVHCMTSLVSFCDGCHDVRTAFPLLAKDLGALLTKDAEMRDTVCKALIMLVQHVTLDASFEGTQENIIEEEEEEEEEEQEKENTLAMAPPDDAQSLASSLMPRIPAARRSLTREEDRRVLASFAKNFLPILFNTYLFLSSNPSPLSSRQAVLGAMRAYASIADGALLEGYFSTLIEKHVKADVFEPAMMDMLRVLLPFMSNVNDAAQVVFQLIQKKWSSTTEKKCYQLLLTLILLNRDQEKPALQQQRWLSVSELVVSLQASSSPLARKYRLSCLAAMVTRVDDQQLLSWTPQILPEVILSMKDPNMKARSVANALLNTLASRFKAIHQFTQLMQMVMAGFAGKTQHMIASTMQSLAQLFYLHYADCQPLQDDLLATVDILLASQSQEIVKATLSLVKVCIIKLEASVVQQYVRQWMEKLLGWSSEGKNHVRITIKHVIERLMKKLSVDDILAMTPEEHHKYIHHIRKTRERTQRKKKEGQTEGLEDSSSEEENDTENIQKRNERARESTSLMEGDVDLLDPESLLGHLKHRSRGDRPQKQKMDLPVAMKNGKMVFDEEEEDREKVKQVNPLEMLKKLNRQYDQAQSNLKNFAGKRNAKRAGSDDEEDEEEKDDDRHASSGSSSSADPRRKKQRMLSKHDADVRMGSQFKSKKGRGDVKRENDYEPYAYIPLNMKMLNKRGPKKHFGELNGIIDAAKKGSRQGRSQRQQNNQRRRKSS